MNITKKHVIIWSLLFILLIVIIVPLIIMIMVNTWLTNEKSWVWQSVHLEQDKKNDLQYIDILNKLQQPLTWTWQNQDTINQQKKKIIELEKQIKQLTPFSWSTLTVSLEKNWVNIYSAGNILWTLTDIWSNITINLDRDLIASNSGSSLISTWTITSISTVSSTINSTLDSTISNSNTNTTINNDNTNDNISTNNIVSTWSVQTKVTPEWDLLVLNCKKNILSLVDSGVLKYKDVSSVFYHVEGIVGPLSLPMQYCLKTTLDKTYNENELKLLLQKQIPDKFFGKITSDLESLSEYEYIKGFFDQDKNRKELDDVVRVLQDVEKETLQSIIMIEQVRASNTQRGVFKQMVKNNLLQSFTQFSLGIGWMKEVTAQKIESALKDKSSPFYLWKEFEHILDYKKGETLRDRLTRNDSYYYQYLYTWLEIKMIKKQWANAGFDISSRVWLIATIYNLGLEKSIPKSDPDVWWALVQLNWDSWWFWELGEKIFITLLPIS